MTVAIGEPVRRVEARDKVTGGARYTEDVRAADTAYAALVGSAISAGRVRSIDARQAERAPGVLTVITHTNRPDFAAQPPTPYTAEGRMPLADDRIHYAGQYIAVVVAETQEQADHAATLVQADYQRTSPVPTLDAALPAAYIPRQNGLVRFPSEYRRGHAETALAASPVRLEQEYRTATLSHAPMEPSSTLAYWEGDRLTIYDSSQAVHTHRALVATAFGLPEDRVRMISSFVGGGFGNKSFAWPHVFIAPMAARVVRRPVRVTISRKQVFTGTGHMAATVQAVRLGADREGRLRALIHDSTNQTSFIDDRQEGAAGTTPYMYAIPDVYARMRVAKVSTGTGGAMRTPGDSAGAFALESALDELAYKIGMDPVELRRRNHADTDPVSGRPWSGKRLLACYEQAAERFGWDRRKAEPGSMRDGDDLVGYGMAGGQRMEHQSRARATVHLSDEGTAVIRSSTVEIGGGGLTTLSQVAAEGLGLPVGAVTFEHGDTDLPASSPTFGSLTSGSAGSAVRLAAQDALRAAIELAVGDRRSPLHGADPDDVVAHESGLRLRDRPDRAESYRELLRRNRVNSLRGDGDFQPAGETAGYAMATFGAHFTEVRINRHLPRVRVVRHVAAFSIGRVLNARTARNQAQGGIIMRLGAALMESQRPDPVSGRFISPALTDYHVPVNADIGEVDVLFVGEPDTNANPLGARGLGEISAVGICASVANAVYHATGRRVRSLPITPDKLL
ncbi:carbon-monoxide dehydrogenase large subunit [Microtetraspora sp. NBRC 13810]|uniref:xanthine dehydrogenase family protein molybdopterin-binding subunit n=1 Tax=Microtetraspora sp. NBRC 13810 TaxID=3030990 RepID=UPI002553EF4F|nr:xanthine dehydrogenase family protein molybdopterin-binding subunit [Microtetraspora sp. NBRC 13810]GLW10193.1 carbon-monoxide dehydrogenase large subunit [Microtetraspora sp. NBRC 13810]